MKFITYRKLYKKYFVLENDKEEVEFLKNERDTILSFLKTKYKRLCLDEAEFEMDSLRHLKPECAVSGKVKQKNIEHNKRIRDNIEHYKYQIGRRKSWHIETITSIEEKDIIPEMHTNTILLFMNDAYVDTLSKIINCSVLIIGGIVSMILI